MSPAVRDLLNLLATVLTVDRVALDSPAGRAFSEERTGQLVDQVPALSREATYLDLLRETGGVHAHGARDVSFGVFGFDEPGYGITSLDEGEPRDGSYFRFGDLMLPEYEENVVFAFDLDADDRRIFATAGSVSDYRPFVPSFEALLERVVSLCRAPSYQAGHIGRLGV